MYCTTNLSINSYPKLNAKNRKGLNINYNIHTELKGGSPA